MIRIRIRNTVYIYKHGVRENCYESKAHKLEIACSIKRFFFEVEGGLGLALINTVFFEILNLVF